MWEEKAFSYKYTIPSHILFMNFWMFENLLFKPAEPCSGKSEDM